MADEYIEREALLERLGYNGLMNLPPVEYYREVVTKFPAADVAPVIHGEWRIETDAEEPNPMFKLVVCSNCNSKANHTYPYCPYCGAINLPEEIKQKLIENALDLEFQRKVGFNQNFKKYNIAQRLDGRR